MNNLIQNAITREGMELIHKELQILLQIKRPIIIQAISDAAAMGDLKENSEYHSAKEEQRNIDSMIVKYEDVLKNSVVIDISNRLVKDIVIFGSTVVLVSRNISKTYKIVSKEEAILMDNALSIASPLCRIMIGKRLGDVFILTHDKGHDEYLIAQIDY